MKPFHHATSLSKKMTAEAKVNNKEIKCCAALTGKEGFKVQNLNPAKLFWSFICLTHLTRSHNLPERKGKGSIVTRVSRKI